jgi:hypothetical protein
MILNRMGRYDLEVITRKVLSSLFGEYGEASMAKTATFMVHLVRNIHFHIEVVTGRREGGEPEEEILSETPSEPSPNPPEEGAQRLLVKRLNLRRRRLVRES